MKNFLRVLSALAVVSLASGFDYIRDTRQAPPGVRLPIKWDPGSVPMQIKMPTTPTLFDGSNFSTTVQAAMQNWNVVIGSVQFVGQPVAVSPAGDFNGISEIVFDSTIFGRAFDTNTLAVTTTIARGNQRSEADIIFNSARTWDSYRGGLRSSLDLQRVATHELGHALGLDHPDEATPFQSVSAIMNSRISNTDAVTADDIAGAQGLYGPPGIPANDNFANAITISTTGSAQVFGNNANATKELGEPAHAANAGGHSVWWKFTAPSNGSVTIDTSGSLFDTTLGVYLGATVAALGPAIASNDDILSGKNQASTVTFSATAGTTFRIAVDGFDGDSAAVTLNLVFTPDGSSGPLTPGAPVITTQPASQSAPPGSNVTFNVAASNNPTSFQWFLGATSIAGATSATFTLTNISSANAGSYHATATNAGGTATSNNATLTVLASGLSNQTVTTGHEVSFTATGATGSIQWQISTDGGNTFNNLANGANVSGATTSTLTLSGVGANFNGFRYRYVATAAGGSVTSNAATLTVATAFFPHPTSIGIDGSGNLYVGDAAANTVQKINTANQVSLVAGADSQAGSADGTAGAARFNQPNGLNAASDATLSVADTANATIRRISASGIVTTLAGSTTARGNTDATGSAATFTSPRGLVADATGTLLVADAMNHTIRKVTAAGAVTTFAGSAGQSGTIDGIGTAARFNLPSGITIDAAGNSYVADTTNNTIRKITAAGVVSTFAGLAGVSGSTNGTGAAALFNRPTGLAIDSGANLYVADTGNSTIRKISPAGAVTTLAGLAGIAGLKDGSGSDVFFNQPEALVLDTSGNIYVADTGNATIRKITQAGAVNTLPLTAVPAPPPPPTPTPTPTPAPSSGGGGGGGGGAPSLWFCAALSLLVYARKSFRRTE